MRAENGLEKNENEDGMVQHSKEQELESRKICHKFFFEPTGIGRALESDNCIPANSTDLGGRLPILDCVYRLPLYKRNLPIFRKNEYSVLSYISYY